MRLLLVEDTADLAESLLAHLRGEGHAVDHAGDAEGARSALAVSDYACVILDLGLPDGSGLSVLRERRAAGDRTPVIVATARDQISDRIAGLDAGADDYVVKPFAFVELLARIDTIARRPGLMPEVTELVLGDLHLDLLTREARRAGQVIDLQPREFLLLKHFMERPGRVQTRTILLEAVWGLHFDPKTSVVETHLSRLRAKIDKPFDRAYLTTLHGVGYVMQP